MRVHFLNGFYLPDDLYAMIENECKRQKAFTGIWPGVYPVIVDALYSHFNSIEDSYNKGVKK